ncbi:MAG: DUF6896 domain-containing protein [Bradymonadia bacterium]
MGLPHDTKHYFLTFQLFAQHSVERLAAHLEMPCIGHYWHEVWVAGRAIAKRSPMRTFEFIDEHGALKVHFHGAGCGFHCDQYSIDFNVRIGRSVHSLAFRYRPDPFRLHSFFNSLNRLMTEDEANQLFDQGDEAGYFHGYLMKWFDQPMEDIP